MLINADFSFRTIVNARTLEWTPSPAKGVDRRMLFRIGGEKARATSIVRYAPDSHFARHGHPGGEEFFVLDGVFQDDEGDYPTGTYVRNPPDSGHAPSSNPGCTIFVKLWQFRADDRAHVVRRPGEGLPGTSRPGILSSLTLFDSADEVVMLEEWQPGANIALPNVTGLELLVISGNGVSGEDALEPLSWLRLPAGQPFRVQIGSEGMRAWFKSAPLLHSNVCAFEKDGM